MIASFDLAGSRWRAGLSCSPRSRGPAGFANEALISRSALLLRARDRKLIPLGPFRR